VSNNNRIIVALDVADQKQAYSLVEQLDPKLCRIKIGKEMFTRFGPTFVRQIIDKNFDVFLDLKFHDIPNTTAKACEAAADLGVWMLNVHALGGMKMLEAARKSLDKWGVKKPLLIAVTVLTSLDDAQICQLGFSVNTQQLVVSLAKLAYEAGLDGVVSSAQEAYQIKQATSLKFLTVTPGIRCETDKKNDQIRTMTPIEAIKNHSDYLVIGRPITQAKNPALQLEQMTIQIKNITPA